MSKSLPKKFVIFRDPWIIFTSRRDFSVPHTHQGTSKERHLSCTDLSRLTDHPPRRLPLPLSVVSEDHRFLTSRNPNSLVYLNVQVLIIKPYRAFFNMTRYYPCFRSVNLFTCPRDCQITEIFVLTNHLFDYSVNDQ